ncbi:Leucine-rich repeat receptor-like protein kinase family [Quillaja saponaria]|uniref:Leucine-rich repeat receptor-like protein kinase family n=1 Tax=Quillaja saponaria TaxID=32244 RepID=A0AAD7QIL2_QUISA|nr:Leucine-rich repeat receptor-like protein kinase family [Quillaja saponaria]
MDFLLYLLIIILAVTSTVKSCPPSDRAALLAFKVALKEPYLGIFNSWTGNNCCLNWYGVSCDPTTQTVADINLRGESEDPIFEKAWTLGVYKDSLFLTLPIMELQEGSLRRSSTSPGLMHLDFSNNQLGGEIPSDFGKLSMLSRALLSRNQLTGSIPVSISKIYRLADLDLSMNRISGCVPDQLGKMPVLSTINLDSNSLSGQIPPTLLGSSGLGILNLSRNSIDGNIPNVFGPNTYFMVLDLSFNKLKGPIPGTLSKAKFIGHLDLSNNHLCGPIPIGSPFDHLEESSFINNDCLCGNPLRTC